MDASYCNNNTTASTLFVGDLSIFVTEKDLIHAFSCYGDIDEIKIMRCNETKKNLSYGFVKFISADAALKAQEELNGSILQGRPMRIGWGMRKPFLQQQSSSTAVRSSIHINYQTNQIDHVLTEIYFAEIFSQYGTVVDLSVKKYEINEVTETQSGYGFVHFPFTAEGIASAMNCCESMNGYTIDNVSYKCSISHRLKKSMSSFEEGGSMRSHANHPMDQSFNRPILQPLQPQAPQYMSNMLPYNQFCGQYMYYVPPPNQPQMPSYSYPMAPHMPSLYAMSNDVSYMYPTMPQHFMSDNFEFGSTQSPYLHLQQQATPIMNDSLQGYFYMSPHTFPPCEAIARHPSIDTDALVHRDAYDRNDCLSSSNNITNRMLPTTKKALSVKSIAVKHLDPLTYEDMHNDGSYSNCTDTEQYSEESNSVLSPSSDMTHEVNEQKKPPQFN